MAKFRGVIGYSPETVETKPGVWEDVTVEKLYYGDVLRVTRNQVEADKVNNDTTLSNEISVLADAYLLSHLDKIRYIKYLGVAWTVSSTVLERPRLILRLGGVYNGPEFSGSEAPGTP